MVAGKVKPFRPQLNRCRRMTNIQFIAVARAGDRVVVASMDTRKPGSTNAAFLQTIDQILAAPDFANKARPRQRIRLVSSAHAINFTSDSSSRVYFVVTAKEYPERIAFALIEELQGQFIDTVGERSLSATQHALNKPCTRVFKALAAKYEDTAKVDRLSRVQNQVNAVTETMQDNVQQMLANVDRADQLVDDTANLADAADKFKKDARGLSRTMWCRKLKMNLLIIFIFLAIVGTIALIVVLSNQ